jgi:hypothetical protein
MRILITLVFSIVREQIKEEEEKKNGTIVSYT